jgi:hypothetical protein
MPSYVTPDELEDFLDSDPGTTHPERLLERASEIIDGLLVGRVYDVDTAGLPTDSTVQTKIKRAVLLQAQYMIALGDETGVKGQFSSLSTGGVSWSRAGDSSAAVVAPAVQDFFRVAGLPGTLTLRIG